jgi:hypothetical protein
MYSCIQHFSSAVLQVKEDKNNVAQEVKFGYNLAIPPYYAPT